MKKDKFYFKNEKDKTTVHWNVRLRLTLCLNIQNYNPVTISFYKLQIDF